MGRKEYLLLFLKTSTALSLRCIATIFPTPFLCLSYQVQQILCPMLSIFKKVVTNLILHALKTIFLLLVILSQLLLLLFLFLL